VDLKAEAPTALRARAFAEPSRSDEIAGARRQLDLLAGWLGPIGSSSTRTATSPRPSAPP
jgi:hypothetical protein